MSTPHNQAQVGEIAEVVLMPGDPLRAKFIADNFLENVTQFNHVRNMFGYTGTYKGKKVSVMGSGMGMASIGIYCYELYQFYGVKRIIRVGSCGAMQESIKLYDLILVQAASTDSNFAYQYDVKGTLSAISTFSILNRAYEEARKKNVRVHVGNVLASDIFYNNLSDQWKNWAKMNILGVEMESYALFATAAYLGKEAFTILTVSDSLVSHELTTAQERQNSFTTMMEIALDVA